MGKAGKSVKTANKARQRASRRCSPSRAASPRSKPASRQTGALRQPTTRRSIALNLPMAKLTPAMAAYFKKCQDKLGFIPNVLIAYAFDMAKLEAFVAMYNDLMLGESGLSKLEREMIAVAVSSQNRCYYCLTAHGAAVRQYSGDPLLGEQMVMNYRAARLSKRQRAMLDFAVKLTAAAGQRRGSRPRAAAPRRLLRPRHLGHCGGGRLLQHVEPRRLGHRHAAEHGLSRPGALACSVHLPLSPARGESR